MQTATDIEDKNGRNAWGEGDVASFQTHQYAEEKLDEIKSSISLLKEKYTEEKA